MPGPAPVVVRRWAAASGAGASRDRTSAGGDESTALYRAPMTVDRFTPERPFSVEARLPAEYEEVEAVFRFSDLPLSV
jgi:hypothetical protein